MMMVFLQKAPYTLSWENDTSKENYANDGIIATLTFEIKEGTPVGKHNISFSTVECLNADGKTVEIPAIGGIIDVKDYVTGDVNDDGEINTKDRMILSRHLADWIGYETLPHIK